MALDCLSVGILVADHLCAPIPHIPQAGGLVLTEHLELNIGGCASNVAMDLARVGTGVGVVGCVGDDVFGQFIIDTLKSADVDVKGVRRLQGVGTSGTLIINVAGEDRRFIHALGANARFTAADIPWDEVRQAKVLYVGGYLVMPALDPQELAEVFRQARQAGVTTVLDIVLPGPGDHLASLRPLLPHTDVFLPNSDEARLLTNSGDPHQQALALAEMGAGTVVITCGGQGSVLVSGKLRLQAGIYPVEYVGGTGAGDAFDAGFIAGLIEGGDLRRCLEWGSVLGASCVRTISATEGVFSRDEAEDFMRSHRLDVSQW